MLPQVVTNENVLYAVKCAVDQAMNHFIHSQVSNEISDPYTNELFPDEHDEVFGIFDDCVVEFDYIRSGVSLVQDRLNYMTGRYTLASYFEFCPDSVLETVILENKQYLIEWAGQLIRFPYGDPLTLEGVTAQARNKEIFALVWLAFLTDRDNFNYLWERYNHHKDYYVNRYRLVE